MHEETLYNLKERLKTLEQAIELEDNAFAEALFEYSSYIGNSQYLSEIIKELAKELDLDRKNLYTVFMFSMLRNGFRDHRLKKDGIGLPLFWDKDIEEEYSLMKQFMTLLTLEQKRLKESKKQGISIFDIVLPEDKDDAEDTTSDEQELFKIRILHNKILAKAAEQKIKKTEFNAGTSVLKIGNKEIKFRKFTEQFHVLRVIFADPAESKKEWIFSEIAELIDESKDYTDKDFHNYFSAINRRVGTETSVKDLFITTNQSVKINEDYL